MITYVRAINFKIYRSKSKTVAKKTEENSPMWYLTEDNSPMCQKIPLCGV